MTRLLVLSFSPIRSDARVLKQVSEFAKTYEVVTCGYGPAPDGSVEHIRIPDHVRLDDQAGKLITLRQYRLAYRSVSGVRWAREHLCGRSFDIVLANDLESVPIALWLKPRYGVHADLHEYSPLLHEEHAPWKRWISPYITWLCRRALPRVTSITTVSRGLQRQYEAQFGVPVGLVTNAAPYIEGAPTPTTMPLRLVHSGACLRNRGLHETIQGVISSMSGATLDMYLTPNDPSYLSELRTLAASSGGRVRVNDPVPYSALAEELRQYDVGVFVLRPVNFSYEWSLPNKIFDYVQARLAVLVGPTPEMAEFVTDERIGVVADDYTPTAIAKAIDGLTVDSVQTFKAASDDGALRLSAAPQVAVWRTAIDEIRHLGEASR
ncbi:glycosyltransferase [Microbacterium aurantiacum]|uniref:glycosyltransferase n=1 Tax=Microbacterium aurantiacum TaxID=162393 RepID=UPI004035DCAF